MTLEQSIVITKIMTLDEMLEIIEQQGREASGLLAIKLTRDRLVHLWANGATDWFVAGKYVTSTSYGDVLKL